MNLQRIVVIGAGTMGSGIAQWFAQQMCDVELVDNSEEQLKKALAGIHSSWDKLVEKEKLTSCQVNQMKRLLEIKSLNQVSPNADLVIEAIIENLKIKHQLFSLLDKVCPSETLFASNTSSISIKEIAEPVTRKDKFGGLHFFNPGN